MRTDQVTRPIAPAVTDRHARWPQVNDLVDEPVEPETPLSEIPSARSDVVDGPLPPIGDLWGRAELDPIPELTTSGVGPVVYPRGRTAPAATAAVVCGVASVPLTLALGIGGVLGILAIISGVAAVRTIRRTPGMRGTGRAVASIVMGTGSALVGLPILALVLMVGSLL
ncbi:DUF4190 domain-containing protein [Gordonia sp. L191]|uniref:DUF4190 domain-containing protein n=1 Tax=Gordonia sp. L191 TaxID=2982699 RepID=UPI0024C02F2C|nr:DUF4190 domain-containing protein [Gordonia sp. L191]WHU48354.1 DUF4190 domain-containing protein [Gordonia sp. L191]